MAETARRMLGGFKGVVHFEAKFLKVTFRVNIYGPLDGE